jgi:multidrug efflux pump
MRIWLNPQKVAERGLTPQEVVAAIQRQNVQVAAGVIGGPPYASGIELQLPINVQGRMQDAEQFGAMIVKRNGNGVVTRLSDIARVELDAAEFGLRSLLDNKSAVAIPIFQAPGSNAIDISNKVRATMAALKQNFPEGVDYSIVYDPTVFVRGSIEAVVHTLLEGTCPRGAGRDRLPADVAGLDHPAARRAGIDHRHLRHHASVRLCRSTRCHCSAWCWRSASSTP